MLLAIDVGNTQTVIGVYEKTHKTNAATLTHMWRIATNKQHTADELRLKLRALLVSEGFAREELSGAALASVVPQLTSAWQQAILDLAGLDVFVCCAQSAKLLFEADYPNPAEIGSDRIADAVAAKTLFGAPVVVVDFGTATNIEVIDARGKFVGGIIAPGVETSAAALFAHATRLPAIELRDPRHAIGRNTDGAIRSGIVYGEADRVDGLVRRVLQELELDTDDAASAAVVATGGLAPLVAAHSSTITAVAPDLTLEGLRLIYESHKAALTNKG